MQRRVSKCCLLFYPTSPSFSLFTSLCSRAVQSPQCKAFPLSVACETWATSPDHQFISPLINDPPFPTILFSRKIIFRLKAPSERKGILRHLRTLGTLTFPVTLVSVVMGLNLTVIRELSQSAPTMSLCSPSLLLDHILFVQPLKVLYIEKAGGGG